MHSQDRITLADVRELLRGRGFLSLLGTRIAGQIGDGMVQAALTSFVLFSPERQATPLKIAIAFGILLLPYSVFGPFIGVLIDKWPRQRILVWASAARALSVLLIVMVVLTGDDGWLLGVAVLFSLGIGRFMQATLSAALPHVARDRELVTANAIAPTAGTLSSAFGGMVGVAIAQLAGDSGTYASLSAAAAIQLLAISIAGLLKRDSLGPDHPIADLWAEFNRVLHELTEGWRQLIRRRDAGLALLVVVFHRSAFGMVSVTAIILTRHALNDSSETGNAIVELALTVGGAGLGAFIGALMAPSLAARWGINRLSRFALVVGAIGGGVALTTVISWPLAATAMPAMVGAGAFYGWVGQTVKVCGDYVLQTAIADEHRGRVFAIYDMAVNVGLFSGILLAALWLPEDGRGLFSPAYATAVLFAALLLLRRPPVK